MLSKKCFYLYALTALSTACQPNRPQIGQGLYCIEADIKNAKFQKCLVAKENSFYTAMEKAVLNDFLDAAKETSKNKFLDFCRILNRANIQCFKEGDSEGIKAHISVDSSLPEAILNQVIGGVKNDDSGIRYKFTELTQTKGTNCCD